MAVRNATTFLCFLVFLILGAMLPLACTQPKPNTGTSGGVSSVATATLTPTRQLTATTTPTIAPGPTATTAIFTTQGTSEAKPAAKPTRPAPPEQTPKPERTSTATPNATPPSTQSSPSIPEITPTATVTPPPTPVPTPTPRLPPCDETIFTVSPTNFESIDHIVSLGNLNPPGHTFPTGHMYVYLTDPDSNGVTDIATLYSPGHLTVTNLRADQHVAAGFTDYGMTLRACADIWLNFGHISALSTELFGEISYDDGWRLASEYSTGGETYRTWRKDVEVDVTAGEVLGTTGGNPGIWAWDFGVVDTRVSHNKDVVNPDRYSYSGSALSAVCFLLYYEDGPVLDQLAGLVQRDKVEGESVPCGSYLQDVPGTAQGNWFLSGIREKNPEDPHLALVHSNLRPARAVFSVGTSVHSLKSGKYEFPPVDQGLLNRDFMDVVPDGQIYGFQVDRFDGVIIVQMPDAETLWIEALTGATTDPLSWAFTESQTIFER